MRDERIKSVSSPCQACIRVVVLLSWSWPDEFRRNGRILAPRVERDLQESKVKMALKLIAPHSTAMWG